jgi:hypothetical protein
VRVKLHRVHHRRVEWIADNNLQRAVVHGSRQHGVLKGDLRGNFAARLCWNRMFMQIHKRPAERLRQPQKKNVLRQAALACNECQQRLLRTIVHRRAPCLAPVVELIGSSFGNRRDKISYRAKSHLLLWI